MRKIFIYSWPFLLSVLIFLSIRVSIKNPGFIEHYYSNGIYPFIATIFSFISNLIPFSLWDVFWVLIILIIVIGLVLVVLKKVTFRWYIMRFLQTIALIYSFFYLMWGFNYFRPGIEKRIGLEAPKNYELSFRCVMDSVIMQTNHYFVSISSSDYKSIDKLVEESFRKQSLKLGINYPNGSRRPKTMLFSGFCSKLGLSGYFGPFFNEIHVNRNLLPMDWPFLLSHEKAHQFGICSEAEANLIAYIICITSDDQRLKYSGYQSILLYFLREASHMKEYTEFLDKIDKRVMQDLRFRQKYYQDMQNIALSKVQTAANNTYLKANNIEKGIRNYNQVISLVLSWYYNSSLIPENN